MSGILHLGDYTICNIDEAIEAAQGFDTLIIKRTIEIGNGSSIEFWNKEDGKEKLGELILANDCDIIAQEFVAQHPSLAEFNPSSVNSIRIVTLVLENEIHYLCGYFRIGQAGVKIDNVCAGGMCSAVSKEGYLCGYGYDKRARKVLESPTGKVFEGFKIPGWDKALSTCFDMHKKMGNFKIISWDIAIDPDENPVFIEMNLKYGAMEYHQLFKGPLFGDLTEKVLGEVYGK